MREEVYDYLKKYGFSAIEIDEIEKKNENMYFTDISEVRKNLEFLEEKYLEVEDIINLVNDNPFMLTEKNNRLEAIDEIYNNKLLLPYEDLKTIIKNNSRAYTLSPIELNKIIDYLNNIMSIDSLKKMLINNPKMLSLKYDEFLKIINNNQ